jgi:ATP-dependent Clp protease ATP-binding subunit ClpC
MSSMGTHQAVQLVWALANAEACASGRARIEPAHFVLAVLKVADDAARTDLERLGVPGDVLALLPDTARETRGLLAIDGDALTARRRALQRRLREGAEPAASRALQLSDSAEAMLQRAAAKAKTEGRDEIGLSQFVPVVMESAADPHSRRSVGDLQDDVKGTKEAENPATGPKSDPARGAASGTSVLDECGRDLTRLAREGRLHPVVGRHAELIALARYLQRTSKRNVLVLGEAGVGKTAVVEGLAQRIATDTAPEFLRRLRIVQVFASSLVSGTRYRGDMEERVQRIIAEATADPNLVLFLDEIHLLLGAGAGSDSPMDVANILKPALARDEFRCIGATTTDAYERWIRLDAAFARRFQLVRVPAPSEEEAIEICTPWAARIAEVQGVVVEPEAVRSAVRLSQRFIRDRALPDKAIDLLENAAAFVKVTTLSAGSAVPGKERPRVGPEHVETVLEEQYGITIRSERVLQAGSAGFALAEALVGQDEAIAQIRETLSGLGTEHEGARPLAVMMFVGPTGVGKTAAAEGLARTLFTDPDAFLRINMSEFKERHELARIMGAPPGFVGHDQPGALFRFVKSQPQGLILLDEMEKAHPEVQDYFLQIFDRGEAADARGAAADLRQYVFVLTCNLADSREAAPKLGFTSVAEAGEAESVAERDRLLKRYFRAEFLARMDRVVSFRAFERADFDALWERQLRQLAGELAGAGLTTVEATDAAGEHLSGAALQQKEGARGHLRLFERWVLAPVRALAQADPPPAIVRVDCVDGQLVVAADTEGGPSGSVEGEA